MSNKMKTITKKNAIKAYKVFNPDWTCRRFQFAVGESYQHGGGVKMCVSGFHACLKVADCFSYYDFNPQNKVAEVLIWGETDSHGEDSKIVGSEIAIVREIAWTEVLELANTGGGCTGVHNSGNYNSGNRNGGNRNSGNYNSGNYNSGNYNGGNYNSGNCNSGNWNSGNYNSGDWNSGTCNSGNRNSGNCNSGDCNSGNWNSGDWNSGTCNSGNCNSGNCNSGSFCTSKDPEIYLFDKPSGMTARQWLDHKVMDILRRRLSPVVWISGDKMTDAEKADNPGWRVAGGYLKTMSLKEAWAALWNELSHEDKQVILTLPNFDADKFKEITGIDVTLEEEVVHIGLE